MLKHGPILEFLKSVEIFCSVGSGGGGGSLKKVAQNVLKHGLILEILKSEEIFCLVGGGGGEGRGLKKKLLRMCWNILSFGIFEIWWFWLKNLTNAVKKFTDRHRSDQIRRSALEKWRV